MTLPEKPKGRGWKLYRCRNALYAPYLTLGAFYWLRSGRNGWLEDVGCSKFSGHRFELAE